MSNDVIAVVISELQRQGRLVGDSANDLRTLEGELLELLATYGNSGGDGEFGELYTTKSKPAQEAAKSALTSIREALDAVSAAIVTASKAYSDADNEATTTAKKVRPSP